MSLGHETLGSTPIGAGSPTPQAADPSEPIVTGVTVTPADAVIVGGQSLQFFANVSGANDPPQTVTWSTTHGTISETGQVTAPAAGPLDYYGIVTAVSTLDPFQKGEAMFMVPAAAVVAPPPVVLAPALRFARPVRDILKGSWRAANGGDLFGMIDELRDNPADFISTSAPTTAELALGPVIDPQSSKNHVVRYKAHAPGGGTLTVELRQGELTVASWFHDDLPADKERLFEQMLTAEQCDSITDYTDLRIKLVAA